MSNDFLQDDVRWALQQWQEGFRRRGYNFTLTRATADGDYELNLSGRRVMGFGKPDPTPEVITHAVQFSVGSTRLFLNVPRGGSGWTSADDSLLSDADYLIVQKGSGCMVGAEVMETLAKELREAQDPEYEAASFPASIDSIISRYTPTKRAGR